MSDVEGRSEIVRKLLGTAQVMHLDIGSRGGPRPEIKEFNEFFTILLCEPDGVEAAKLEALGYETVRRAFWSRANVELRLAIARKPANSSVLEPRPRAMKFWQGTLEKIKVQRIETLRTTTIHDEEAIRAIQFDDIKVDAEGADFEILKGLGKSQPFFIQSEVNTTELREGQGLLHDISALLFDRGYFLADICFRRFNGMPNDSGLPGERRSSRGVGLRGDAYFIADWMRDEGRAIIDRAPLTWAAVMVLKGYEDVLRWICEHQYWDALADVRVSLEEEDE